MSGVKHGLRNEGAAFSLVDGSLYPRLRGGTGGPGRGACSCGAVSEILESGAARKRWHKIHKAEEAEK